MNGLSYLEKLLDGAEVEWLPLGQLGELVRGSGLPKSDFTESGVPAIHYGQIYTFYGLSTETTKSFVSHQTASKLKKVNQGDVVITNTSENFSDVVKALVYLGSEQAVTGGHATVFKPCSGIIGKYFAYYTQTDSFASEKRKHSKGTKVIDVSATDMAKIVVPIPCPGNPEKSLAIQSEIVRILDTFTALTTELTMRKKQYNYYRDKLLSFKEGEVEWKTLGEIVNMRAGQHISARNIMDKKEGDFVYPCFGGNGIRGYVKEKSHEGEHLLIGRQGALCGNVQRMKGKFYATEHAVVVSAMRGINIDWAFHMLTAMNLRAYLNRTLFQTIRPQAKCNMAS